MAHEIDLSNDKENMAYVGELPWHGLGKQLTADAGIDTWKREAGMDWSILTSPVIYEVPVAVDEEESAKEEYSEKFEQMTMDERVLFFRSDNHAALSVVSNNFKIVQPSEILEFYRDLVADAGFSLETAGCLFGGRKFWALAKCGESARIMGQDEIKPYLLLASACDGSMATVAHYTSVRVVCNNTLRMAVGADGNKAKIRVPHNASFDHSAVKLDLGVAKDSWEQFIHNANRLASTKIDRDTAIDMVAKQLKKEWLNQEGGAQERDEMLQASIPLRRIIQLFDGAAKGAEFASAKGTAWGLVNAVTEYYDHEAGNKADRNRSFERAHLTDRANFKVNFANELLAMVG